MNKTQLAKSSSNLVPQIIRGAHMDFFAKSTVTQTQFFMLLAIQASPRPAMSSLAKNLAIRMPTATGIADRLVKSGYIKRENRLGDRRSVVLVLTPKGHAYIDRFKGVIEARWLKVLEVLEDSQVRSFYQIVHKLTEHLQKTP